MTKLNRIHASIVSDEKLKKEMERRKRIPSLPLRVSFNLVCSGVCPSCGSWVTEKCNCICGQRIKWEVGCFKKDTGLGYCIERYRYKSMESEQSRRNVL